jgi:methylmalonyl-CoA mutase N-terminal domain/subunit
MKKEIRTSSGIVVPEKFENADELAGSFPYTRGIHSTMYRERPWTMRQYAGFSTAKESNLRYRELLKNGAKGLSVAFDLPTQMGYDSDHELARGEVGKVGVAIDCLDDMRILFHEIDLKVVSTSMTINATAAILLCMYQIVAEEKGIDAKDLEGTIQNDILKEYIARGTYIYPPKQSLRIITDIFSYCKKNIPKWNTISISGYHIREAGCTAVQEVAFTLANGLTYVQAAVDAGLSIDEFGPRLSFFFNVHNNFLEEVAKFRAARSLWAKLIKEKYNPQDERSLKLRFHSQVAGSTLTAQQPLNNIVRVTLQAMAAVLGGTQSLHTNAYDEALQLPTSHSAQIALRTQQIIANETSITDFVDPLGGSEAVEYLTSEIVSQAQELIQTVNSKGGVVKCIESGFIQNEILDSAYRAQIEIDNKKQIVVGVNQYIDQNIEQIPNNKISSLIESEQIDRLKKWKKNRDNKIVLTSLKQLSEVAKSDQNLLYSIKDCLKNGATLGEIADLLRQVYGVYRPPVMI